MVGVHDARAPPPPSRRALGRRERLLRSRHLVRPHFAETRRAMSAEPARRRTHPAAPSAPPGRVHRPHRTTRAHRRVRVRPTNPVVPKPSPGPKAARRRRRRSLASATRAPRRTSFPVRRSLRRLRTSPTTGADPIPDASIVSVAPVAPVPRPRARAPVVPLALVGRLRLPPLRTASPRVFSDSDATDGRASRDEIRRARARSSRRRHRVASSSRRRRGGGGVFRGFGRGPDILPSSDSDRRSRRTRRTPRLRPRGKVVSTPSARWWR